MKLQDMYPIVMILVTVGILLGIGATIQSNIQDQSGFTTDVFLANDSLTLINGTAVALDFGEIQSGMICFNQTVGAGTPIGSGNYTATTGNLRDDGTYTVGTVLLSSGTQWNNTAISCNYTYDAPTVAYNATGKGIGALFDFSTWFAIIVVILAAAIIVGLVVRSFSRRTS